MDENKLSDTHELVFYTFEAAVQGNAEIKGHTWGCKLGDTTIATGALVMKTPEEAQGFLEMFMKNIYMYVDGKINKEPPVQEPDNDSAVH